MPEEIRVRHEIDLGQLERFEKALKNIKDNVGSSKITNELNKQVKAQSEKNRLEKEEVGIVGKLLAEQKKLRKEQKETTDPKRLKALNKELYKTSVQLKKAKDTTATWSKALGSFGFKFNALANAVNRLGSAITQGLNRAMKAAVITVREFESAMAGVQAISKATSDEFKKLRGDAIRLGGATIFTARQVAELQMNYAKLGFSTQEILGATEATLALAAATDEGLAASALVAGSTLRAFQLEATKTRQVVDVMTASFTSSALNLEHWRESMKFTASIAQGVGLDIETTAAAFSVLADAGIKGSIAGTSMKNILLRMADANSGLAKKIGFSVQSSNDFIDALEILKEQGTTLTEVFALTDRRAAPSARILIELADSVREVADAYDRAFGEAALAAEIRMDTLKGSLTILKSAWEKFVISVEDGSGVLTVKLRELVDMTTAFVNKFEEWTSDDKVRFRAFREAANSIDEFERSLRGLTKAEVLDAVVEKMEEVDAEAENAEMVFKALKKSMMGEGGFLIGTPEEIERYEAARGAVELYNKELERLNDLRITFTEETENNQRQFVAEELALLKVAARNKLTIEELYIKEKATLEQNEIKITIKDLDLRKQLTVDSEKEKSRLLILAKIKYYEELRELVDYEEQKIVDAQLAALKAALGGAMRAGDTRPATAGGISTKDLPDVSKLLDVGAVLAKNSYIGAIMQPTPANLKEYFVNAGKATDFVIDQFEIINNAEMRLLNEQISRFDTHISELQRALDEEYELRREGKANRVSLLEDEIRQEQERREAAYEKQEVLEKKKRRLQSLAQLSNMLTSATNIWEWATEATGPLAIPIAIAAIAAMIGSWIGTIGKMGDIVPQFAEGGWIDGEPHSRGGVMLNAEGGEFIMNKSAARENADILEAMNNGDMWDKPIYKNIVKVDSKKSEGLLQELVTITKERPYDFGPYIEYKKGNTTYREKK